jgi:hypothetical protein
MNHLHQLNLYAVLQLPCALHWFISLQQSSCHATHSISLCGTLCGQSLRHTHTHTTYFSLSHSCLIVGQQIAISLQSFNLNHFFYGSYWRSRNSCIMNKVPEWFLRILMLSTYFFPTDFHIWMCLLCTCWQPHCLNLDAALRTIILFFPGHKIYFLFLLYI